MVRPIIIDGSRGEGGGQILRSSLALSIVTGEPLSIENIRAGRKRPGLLRQHLTAVRAAARISNAHVEGDALSSMALSFHPQPAQAGTYHFAVGTAGSAVLVLQTILPALMLADGPSVLTLEGGTHNPWAPPFEFLTRAFAPTIERMGPRLHFELVKPGFHPAGGGRFTVHIDPAAELLELTLLTRGRETRRSAEALVAHLSEKIGERELAVLKRRLALPGDAATCRVLSDSAGPGNALVLTLEFEHAVEVIATIGRKGVSAEKVASETADVSEAFLASEAPVGVHLADQLLLPMAIAGGGAFRTLALSEHARTNIDVIKRFLDGPIRVQEEGTTVVVRFD